MEGQEASVVVEAESSRLYALTLRRTKNPDMTQDLLETMYHQHLFKLSTKGVIIEETEFEVKGGLHLHGIIRLASDFNFKLLRVRGWHLHLREIYNKKEWIRYIQKENKELIKEIRGINITNSSTNNNNYNYPSDFSPTTERQRPSPEDDEDAEALAPATGVDSPH